MIFCFDKPAEEVSIETLMRDIPYLVYKNKEGISFNELFSKTCNNSPASAKIYKEAISELIKHKIIEVWSQDGVKRKSSNIDDKDQIIPPKQRPTFFFEL